MAEAFLGQTFGRYRIDRLIGSGGMAMVFLASHVDLGRKVALKILNPSLAADPRIDNRFLREAQAAATLRHPHIVSVHDVGEQGAFRYLVMDYVEGENLASVLARQGRVSLDTALTWGEQIAQALAHAHSHKIVHRDIKPQNIIIATTGEAIVTDFGIARALEGIRLTATGMLLGTPEYMAPEQATGGTADQRADLYSLGVVLFEMVTGRLPFEGETPIATSIKHITDPPPSPRAISPDIPVAVEELILKALVKDLDRRFQTALGMADAIERVRKGKGRTSPIPPSTRAEALQHAPSREVRQPATSPAQPPRPHPRQVSEDGRPASQVVYPGLSVPRSRGWVLAGRALVVVGLGAIFFGAWQYGWPVRLNRSREPIEVQPLPKRTVPRPEPTRGLQPPTPKGSPADPYAHLFAPPPTQQPLVPVVRTVRLEALSPTTVAFKERVRLRAYVQIESKQSGIGYEWALRYRRRDDSLARTSVFSRALSSRITTWFVAPSRDPAGTQYEVRIVVRVGGKDYVSNNVRVQVIEEVARRSAAPETPAPVPSVRRTLPSPQPELLTAPRRVVPGRASRVFDDGVRITLGANKSAFATDEDVIVIIGMAHAGISDAPVTLYFPTSQRYDLALVGPSGSAIVRWSQTVTSGFRVTQESVTLGPGESLRPFSFSLDQLLRRVGRRIADLPSGRYIIVGSVACDCRYQVTLALIVR